MEMGGSSGSSESQMLKIGLKFGQKIYFGDVGVGGEAKSAGGSSPVSGGGGGGPQKKGRTVLAQGQPPPRCQVEGCNLDLSDAKTYYSRHKVCGVHSKTPKVIVNGLEQRFCQQCSRFHLLPEFDQGKRSCRRRLAGHNERRRKPSPGTLLPTRYGSLPNIFENEGNPGGFMMDFSGYSRGRIQWANTRVAARIPDDLPPAIEKLPPLQWHGNLDNPPPYINPNVPPGGCFNGVQDSNCALSLLSNHSSGSRNQTLSLEYYANPDPGAHMVQPVAGTMVQGQFSPANSGWGYDAGEAHLGLGQIAQSGYSGELGHGHQTTKEYDSATEHVHWLL